MDGCYVIVNEFIQMFAMFTEKLCCGQTQVKIRWKSMQSNFSNSFSTANYEHLCVFVSSNNNTAIGFTRQKKPRK